MFVGGVRQATDTYTLSGTTLTFTEAPPSGTNNIQVLFLGLGASPTVPSDGSVTSVKFADGAVSTAKIADGSVTGSKIAVASVAGNVLIANTITGDKLGQTSISTNNIVDGAITGDKIAANTIPSADLTTTGISAGSYGGSSSVPVITVDAQGRLSYAANVSLSAANTPIGVFSYMDKDATVPNGYVVFTNTVIVNANLYPSLASIMPTTLQYDTTISTNYNISVAGNKGDAKLGSSIAIDGNYIAIGESTFSSGNVSNVKIYTANNGTWELQQTIVDPSNDPDSFFGFAVDLDIGSYYGDQLLIGAPGDDTAGTNYGRVYRYVRSGNTWNMQNTYSGFSGWTSWGESVSIANNFIVIGSPNGGGGGRAHGFRVNTGNGNNNIVVTYVKATDPSLTNEQFGYKVAVFNDGKAVITDTSSDVFGGQRTGAAYYFPKFTQSGPRMVVSKPLTADADSYGSALARQKNGNVFVIGASDYNSETGFVAVYNVFSNSISSIQTINNPTAQTSSGFGRGLGMSGDGTVIIGQFKYDGANTDQGRAYIYTRSNANGALSFSANIDNPSPQTDENFGLEVAIGNTPNTFIVAAPNRDVSGLTDAGIVYINGAAFVVLTPLPNSSQHKTLVRIA